MSEFDPEDLVELRVRGEFIDVVGLLSQMAVDYEDREDRAAQVMDDLLERAGQQINFGLARKQLKRLARSGEEKSYRGIDVRIHEFDPRHPDEESELDVNILPPFEEGDAYAVVMKTEEGLHMAGYPDELEMQQALELASGLRIFARDLEEIVNSRAQD